MLKKLLIALGALVLLVLLGLTGFYVHIQNSWDKVYDNYPLPEVKVSTDPKVIAQGRYLVHGPAHCSLCHMSAGVNPLELDLKKEPDLSGGLEFVLGPLGKIYSANLSPDKDTGIGRYSDGQIARMMRYAVRPNGLGTVKPMMPFGNLAEDDLVAVISYLRSRPPVKNKVPENQWTFMGKMIRTLSTTFQPRDNINPPKKAPEEKVSLERGKYLAHYVSNCEGCHTPRDPMTFEATGPSFSGGFEMEPMPLPGADKSLWYRAPNLTPAKGSSLSKFPDDEAWVARFRKSGRRYDTSPMPWEAFGMMSDTDLRALYLYLKSLQGIENDLGEQQFKKL